MKLRDDIELMAAAFGRMAAELKDHQEKLLSYGRELESVIAERTLALDDEKARLELTVQELSKKNQEITLFRKMDDFLQTANSEAEAYSIITDTVKQLFPEDSGAVFVLNGTRDMLEAAAVWGPLAPANLIFPPNECWAYRRGLAHLAVSNERRCPHVTDNDQLYCCMPLLAQGEMLGIFYLMDGPVSSGKSDDERMAAKANLAKILADNIGLGIANLKLRENTRNLSILDPLTGLFNRRYMEETLTHELYRGKRNGTQLAVIMIDIDHFKQFNDSFGHDGGDAVLSTLGGFFKKHVRGSDIACRYGGEEFLLVLSPTTADGARQSAEKIREDARGLDVTNGNLELGKITLSLGVAIFPDHALEAASLIKAADAALYRAKRAGRNRLVICEHNPLPQG